MRRVLLSLALIWVLSSGAYSQRPIQVAILPFELLGLEQVAYLRKAMIQMMSTRIALKGKFEVVDETRLLRPLPLGEPGYVEKAADAGRLLGVDFIILGGLTKLGDTISLDSKAVEVRSAKVVAWGFAVTKSLDEVAAKVEQLADQISAGIENHAIAVKAEPKRPPAEILGRPQPRNTRLGTLERRIEQLEKRLEAPESFPPEAQTVSPRFEGDIKYKPPSSRRRSASTGAKQIRILGESEAKYAKPSWESRTFFGRIMDVAVGDVTGDGKPEMAVLLLDELFIYRWDGKGFHQLIYSLKAKSPANLFYSLDVADINGDGIEEIFVTSLASQFVNSFVLEFKDNNFVKTWSGVDKYFRVLDLGGDKRMLAGQSSGVDRPFWGPIRQIVWRGGRYVEGRILSLPQKANLYNFALPALGRAEQTTPVVFSEDGEIYVYGDSVTRISDKKLTYGGHERYIEYDQVKTDVQGEQKPARIIHHGRLPLRDVDRNGALEIVTVKNDFSLTDALLPAFQRFDEGAVVGLEWSGSRFEERWEAKKIPGSIINIGMADVDGDGKEELLVAVLHSSGGLGQIVQVAQLDFSSLLSSLRDTSKSSVYLFELD